MLRSSRLYWPNFNPPSPCGEGPTANKAAVTFLCISIHPPRVGRDRWFYHARNKAGYFNPPSPCGEGLDEMLSKGYIPNISIHPPRVGRD